MSDPIYQDATMAQVRAVDGTYISYPFIEDGDTQTKVYNMVCTQLATSYNAAQVALDTPMSSAAAAGVIALPFPADSAAYFVGDTGHTPAGGGMISFTRTFANIPQPIKVSSGSAFVTFPGLNPGTVTPGAELTVTSLQRENIFLGVNITTSTSNNLTAGDIVYVNISFKVGQDPFIHNIAGQYAVIKTNGPNTFRIDPGFYWSSYTSLQLVGNPTVTPLETTREPVSINVNTSTRYDYYLPGVTSGINNVEDLSVPAPFLAVDINTGKPAQTLITLSGVDQTSPGVNDYVDMIKNKHNIIIESSLGEWAGNILVMKTKTCRAK